MSSGIRSYAVWKWSPQVIFSQNSHCALFEKEKRQDMNGVNGYDRRVPALGRAHYFYRQLFMQGRALVPGLRRSVTASTESGGTRYYSERKRERGNCCCPARPAVKKIVYWRVPPHVQIGLTILSCRGKEGSGNLVNNVGLRGFMVLAREGGPRQSADIPDATETEDPSLITVVSYPWSEVNRGAIFAPLSPPGGYFLPEETAPRGHVTCKQSAVCPFPSEMSARLGDEPVNVLRPERSE